MWGAAVMGWDDARGGGERMPSMRANICAALNFGLFDGDSTHLFLVIEFGEDGAHHLTCVKTLAYCYAIRGARYCRQE